ncbi:SOS response-associated peptidase family protein [Arthrobacter sp. TMS2-4]
MKALIPANGYYEFWPDPTKPKDAHDKRLVTAAILTQAAPDALGHIHARTPVIIPGDLQDQRLGPTMTERDQVQHFIDTIPQPTLVPRIVGKEVGSVRNDGPELIAPVAVVGGWDAGYMTDQPRGDERPRSLRFLAL